MYIINYKMLISIEGNIGSGKSVFCNYLKEHFSRYYNKPNNDSVYFVDEPVSDWESIKDSDGNLIEHFYKCPEKYSYCFQMTAYISRLVKLKNVLKKAKSDDIIIMERCVFSDYNVFARMLHADGKINDIEFQCYKTWFDHFLEDLPSILFVYIKADPEVCSERIKKRNRDGESNISLDYLKKCEEYHEDWFKAEKKLITFDGNKDTTFHSKYLDILKQMMCYKMNKPKNFDGNDSDNEYYYEYRHETAKWNKRLFDKTLEQCNKRTKMSE